MQTAKFKALKLATATSLQPYNFIQPLQQYLTDMLLFDLVFTVTQVVGVVLLILLYTGEVLYNLTIKKCFVKKDDSKFNRSK